MMTITIDLSEDVHQQLEKNAQLRGASVSETIAQLLAEVENRRRADFFEDMRAKGILLPKKPVSAEARQPFTPIEVQGKPVSESIIEERR